MAPQPPTGTVGDDRIEVVPVVVLSHMFSACSASIPDIRDFVRLYLTAGSLVTAEDNRAVSDTVSQALLDAAGPVGTIQIPFRVFSDHVKVDVLKAHPRLSSGPTVGSLAPWLSAPAAG